MVGAAHAATTESCRSKKIIVFSFLDDERSLNLVVVCLDALFRHSVGVGVSGDGLRFSHRRLEVGLKLHELDAVPERAESEPWRSFVVDNEIRVDTIVVVSTFGFDDLAEVHPFVVRRLRVERLVGCDTDGRGVLSE